MKSHKRKNEKKERQKCIKEKITDALELPKEIVMNIPKITMLGIQSLMIENYKGIIEYSENKIRINTSVGVMMISGELMVVKEISSEDVIVEGTIGSIEFSK